MAPSWIAKKIIAVCLSINFNRTDVITVNDKPIEMDGFMEKKVWFKKNVCSFFLFIDNPTVKLRFYLLVLPSFIF